MFDVEDPTLPEPDALSDREDEPAFDPEAAEEELATLSSHLDAATYRQLVLIRQLDDSGHWANAGATTCAAWLSWRIGMNENAARERLRIAHALRDLPKVADAMRTGTLSYSKVRAIVRVATPQMEDRLLEYARYTTASHLERICRGVRQQQLLDTEEAESLDEAERLRRAFEARDLHLRARGDGTVQVVVTLMPDEAQRVFTAVETMRDAMREECPSLPPTYADAFVRLVDVGFEEATVDVVQHDAADLEATNHSAELNLDATNHSAESNFAANENAAGLSAESNRTARRKKKVSGGDTQRVLIHLAPHLLSDGLVANLDDGTWIAPETWRRVACDCALDLAKVDEAGKVLDVGRRTRTIPPALTRALDVRDAGRCRFPAATTAASSTVTTSSTGPTTERPNSTTCSPSAAHITDWCTRAAGRWSWTRTKRASSNRTGRSSCGRGRREWRMRWPSSKRRTRSWRSERPRG